MIPRLLFDHHVNELGCILFVVSFLLLHSCTALDAKCEACKDFVVSFQKGYEKTANSNFGGGNTDWEETRLGSYATSETRLIEILEHVCDTGSDKHQCHNFAAQHEETIEKWYFHLQKQEENLEKWLCIESAKVCCPPNTYGPNCNNCPGAPVLPCMFRGECDGNGTRTGSGKCRCQKGYSGPLCDTCSKGFDLMEKNETYIECEDENECEDPNICPAHEFCFNTEGSYKCNKCHHSCRGCTGVGAARCKTCAEGYVNRNGTCTDEMIVAQEYLKQQKQEQSESPKFDEQPNSLPVTQTGTAREIKSDL